MITGNKGEWSEIYALFKLLGDKQLITGDADLNKVEELFFPIIKIIRKESNGIYEYALNGDLVVISGVTEELRIPIQTFSEQAVGKRGGSAVGPGPCRQGSRLPYVPPAVSIPTASPAITISSARTNRLYS